MGGRRPARPATAAAASVDEAIRATLAAQQAAFARELAAARAGKVRGIHQLRVAVRRLRAVLALAAGAVPPRVTTALSEDLAELGHAVGPVRDLDVLAAAVARRGKRIGAELEPAIATVERHVRDRRAAAHALLVERLDAPPTRKLADRLAALAAAPRRHGAPDAADVVRPLVRDLVRAGRRHHLSDSPPALHRLRIRAKRLRYALDALDGLGGDAGRELRRRLLDLQHLLGDQRDATNQRTWLLGETTAFAGDPEALVALGALTEALRRRAERLAGRVPGAWRRIDRRKALAAVLRELERPASRESAA